MPVYHRTLITLFTPPHNFSTDQLPVLYVLTKKILDPQHAAKSLVASSKESLKEHHSQAVILMYDVGFTHLAGQ